MPPSARRGPTISAGPIGEAHVLISPDFRGFGARLKTELAAAVRAVKTPAVKIQFDIHKGSLTKAIAEANKILKTSGVKAKIEFDLNRGSLNRTITQAKAAARAAGVKFKVDVDGNSVRGATRDVGLFDRRSRAAFSGLRKEVFQSNIRLREMANILGGATLPVLVSLASVGVAAFGSLTSAIVAASAAAAALPNFLAAAVQAVAVLGLAFSGVSDAVKAMADSQITAGRGAASGARQQVGAANAIRDARLALTRATRDAGQANADAARRVREAERGVAEAVRDSRTAQLELNQARREARDGLVDLRLEEARLNLDSREAALSRAEAEQELARVSRDPRATALELQRAQLRAEQARLAERDTRRRIELNDREIRQGVEGSDRVKTARERLADANRRVVEAAGQVADAERQSARQRVAAAEQVADAQRRVADAQTQAAQAAAGAAGGVDKVGEAMARLSPAAQRFARFLFSLKPRLDALKATAAAGLFPGLEDGLRRLIGGLFPVFRATVDQTARALGGLAVEGGKLLASGPFRRDFAQLGRDNVQIIRDAGQGSLNLVDALRNLIAAARPLTLSISAMVLGWTENVRAAAATGRETGRLTRFFEAAGGALRSLARIAGNVGATIAAVLSAAFPSGVGLLGSLEKATGRMRELATSSEGLRKMREFFERAKPAIETVAGLFVILARKLFEVVVHVKTATEAIAGFLDKHPELKDLLGTALALALAFKAFNIGGLLGIVGSLGQLALLNPVLALVAGAVLAIGAAFFLAYTQNKPFRDTVDRLGRSLKETVLPAIKSFGRFIKDEVIPAIKEAIPFIRDQLLAGLDFLQQALEDNKPQLELFGRILLQIGKWIGVTLIPALFKLWSVQLRGLFTALGLIVGVLGFLGRVFVAFLRTALDVFGAIVTGAAKAFGWMPGIGPKLKTAAKAFQDFRQDVNDSLDGIKDKKVTVTASGAIKLPPGIPFKSVRDIVGGAATGGPIDGAGPKGRDSVLMYGAPGEHMLTAQEVDRAGGHGAIYALRRALRSGWRVPGFASGGAVEDARFRVAPRTSTARLEEGVDRFDQVLNRLAATLGRRLADAIPQASGAVSGVRFGGATMSYIAGFLRDAGVAFQVISGFRPGAVTRGSGRQSLHALGRALDLVGSGKSSMLDIWAAATRIPFKKEVIFSPAPFQVYGSGKHAGPPSNPRTRADHYNHVHVGLFDRGGPLLPGLNLMENRTGRVEHLAPVQAGRDATGRLSFGGQGLHVENLIVQPLSGRFRMSDVMTELRLQGVH